MAVWPGLLPNADREQNSKLLLAPLRALHLSAVCSKTPLKAPQSAPAALNG
jgi:hypothetical protein